MILEVCVSVCVGVHLRQDYNRDSQRQAQTCYNLWNNMILLVYTYETGRERVSFSEQKLYFWKLFVVQLQ